MKVADFVGIELGTPWKLNNSSRGTVIPVLLREGFRFDRSYLLNTEAEADVSIKDTGSINRVRVTNSSDMYIFFRKGTIFEGKTQERTVVNSVAVPPHTSVNVNVRCVHSSKPIFGGTIMYAMSALAPLHVEKTLTSKGNQSDTWRSISSGGSGGETTSDNERYRSNSGISSTHAGSRTYGLVGSNYFRPRPMPMPFPTIVSDDLVTRLKNSDSSKIDEILKKMPANHERQIGMFVIEWKSIKALEMFDHPDAWEALSQQVTKNYADILNSIHKDEKKGQLSDEDAIRMCQAFLADFQVSIGSRVFKADNVATYEISNNKLTGEFTIIDDMMVHLIGKPSHVWRYDTKKTKTRPIVQPHPFARRTTSRRYGASVVPSAISAHHTVKFMTMKRGYMTLATLQNNNQGLTFTELLKETGMSSRTVDRGLSEAQDLDLVEKLVRVGNGQPVYKLTNAGRDLDPKKFKAYYSQ